MKQIDTGRFLGYVKLLVQQVMPYLSGFTFVFAGIAAYVPISEWFIKQGWEFPFWMFVLVIAIACGALIVFEYVIMFPSFWSSYNKQLWEHDNPMREEFDKLNKRLDEMDKRMTKVE